MATKTLKEESGMQSEWLWHHGLHVHVPSPDRHGWTPSHCQHWLERQCFGHVPSSGILGVSLLPTVKVFYFNLEGDLLLNQALIREMALTNTLLCPFGYEDLLHRQGSPVWMAWTEQTLTDFRAEKMDRSPEKGHRAHWAGEGGGWGGFLGPLGNSTH